MVLVVRQLYFLPLDHHLQVGHSNHAPPGGKYNYEKNKNNYYLKYLDKILRLLTLVFPHVKGKPF